MVLKYFKKPKDRLEMCVFDEQKKEILKKKISLNTKNITFNLKTIEIKKKRDLNIK